MSNPPSDSLNPAELRNIGLFGALSDEVIAHLANTLTVQTPMRVRSCSARAMTPTRCSW